MRRHIIYYLTFIPLLVITGCSLDTLEPDSNVNQGNEEVIIMGRLTRFTDCNVATRGLKEGDEGNITSIATAIFEVNENASGENALGDCVYYRYEPNQSDLIVPIEREGYTPNARYAIYLFANMPGMANESLGITDETISTLKLEALLNVCKNVDNINIPENGIPMMGSLGDTFSTTFDNDGHEFVMSPEKNGNITAPTIDNGEPQSMLTIPMKALYAKINFSIQVIPDQSIEGNNPPQFTISGYTVNNIPKSVDFNNTTTADKGDCEVIETLEGNAITGNIYASGTNKIEFSFYLPENLVTPATSWENYDYPFIEKDNNGNGTIREEDKKYRQRYKSKLLGENQKATNVVISGTFRDHQGHFFDVDYTIHLGADEYGDFNIKRNYEYNNIVTIRGIQASDEPTNTNKVFIDHRVNIEFSQPGIISIHREVLLDSHFEIRPLRIKKNDIGFDVANAVKVQVLNPTGDTGTKWMRLERSLGLGTNAYDKTNESGESIYITEEGASKGKRRYFTYNLVTGSDIPGEYDYPLNNSYEVVVPLTETGECVWVYVDECTDKGDGVRSGIIKVTYGNATFDNNGVATSEFNSLEGEDAVAYPPIEYQLSQRKLFHVEGEKEGGYDIEYHEEYLHNYDAADDYLQTQYEGMKWGLDGIQLSYDNNALFFDTSINLFDFFINAIKSFVANPKYDFYIQKHDTSVPNDAVKYSYNGYEFSNKIIQVVNGYGPTTDNDTDINNNIDVLTLNEQPKSAIEYCYNKNKRNAEGHVVWQNSNGTYNTENLNWYLPAIDEIEDIVMSKYEAEDGSTYQTYGRFQEFQEKFYWSSQPSYIRNHATYDIGITVQGKYYYDDKNHARATSVSFNGSSYEYVRSGVTSDFNRLEVNGGVFNPNSEFQEDGTYTYTYTEWIGIFPVTREVTVVLGTINRESGNKPRNSMARVRCVRRQSDQQQQ